VELRNYYSLTGGAQSVEVNMQWSIDIFIFQSVS
jgi:hypothetical protein